MAKFIKPDVDKIKGNYNNYYNNCVNINLCKSLIASEFNDGYGNKYPIIKFTGCDEVWYFNKYEHELRDKKINDIINSNN